jgi:hypothetical protein
MTALLLCPRSADAQKKNSADTARKDSLNIYKEIKEVAEKRKVTNWLYKFIFIDPASQPRRPIELPSKSGENRRISSMGRYEGRTIRHVHILTLDPFGSTIYDTTRKAVTGLERFGNRLHIKSRRFTIRNQLLFKKGERLDPLSIKESERILRQSAYVRDAKVNVTPLKGKPDSVDVYVTVHDIWSVGGSGGASTSRGVVNVYERNFLGLAHQLNNTFYYYPNSSTIDYTLNYLVPYIRNSFITGRGFYYKVGVNTTTGFSLNRDFYSPLARWAGGIDITGSNSKVATPITFIQQDYWLGRAFPVLKGSSELSRSTKLLVAGRVLNTNYLSRPALLASDSLIYSPYLNSTTLLGSVAFSERTYYKDNYIYRYGSMEDVPEGRLLALIGGVENKIPYLRYYTGVRAAFARHYDSFGYLSSSWDYGTFTSLDRIERGVIAASVGYFSDLMTAGSLKIRQFANVSLTHGIFRNPGESLNLQSNGIYGFSNANIRGTDRLTTNLQTVVYTPLKLVGFYFAPVYFMGFGLLGSEDRPILRSTVYQVYGLGLLIRNENLVINTIQVSLGYYPNIGEGSQIKFNPATVYDLRFRDLFLSKPSTVPYQ